MFLVVFEIFSTACIIGGSLVIIIIQFFKNYIIIIFNMKEFENLSVEKRRFRLRWDSSPGLSPAQSKASFFPQKDFQIL